MKIDTLKTSWVNKEIPCVTKGFWGDKLTKDNVNVKTIAKDCNVLVGDKQSGYLTDKEIVDYFMQFVNYPKYRKYIIDTLRKLNNFKEEL